MSVANAIIPNNFELFSGPSEPIDSPKPKLYSSGYTFSGENPIPGTLANQFPVALPEGEFVINYCTSVRGGNVGLVVNKVDIKVELLVGATVIATHEYLAQTDTATAGDAYAVSSIAGSVIVKLTAPATASMRFTVGPENQATVTNVLGQRGISATQCSASGNFITV